MPANNVATAPPMMAPRNANFQPQQSIKPKANDEPKRFISNNASKLQSPSGKLPVGRLRDGYLPQISWFSVTKRVAEAVPSKNSEQPHVGYCRFKLSRARGRAARHHNGASAGIQETLLYWPRAMAFNSWPLKRKFAICEMERQ